MATIRCKCGTILRDDDPDNSYLLFAKKEFDVDIESVELLGRARDAWNCWTCGRLWIFWDPLGNPTEYVMVE